MFIKLFLFLGFFAVGQLGSLLVNQTNMAIFSVVLGLLIAVVFGGSSPSYGKLPTGISWLWYESFAFWASEAFVANELMTYAPPYDVALVNDVNTVYGKNYGQGYMLGFWSRDCGLCFLMGFFFRCVNMVVLKFKDRHKHR